MDFLLGGVIAHVLLSLIGCLYSNTHFKGARQYELD